MKPPGPSHSAMFALFVFVILLGCVVSAAKGQSGNHGDGHAQMHDQYQHWRMPDHPSVSCCNNADCRPTRSYMGEDGLWRAWNGHEWLTVPPSKVLPVDHAKDGRSHLCESAGSVFCFSPSEPKS